MVLAWNLQYCGKCSRVIIDSVPYLLGNLLSTKEVPDSRTGDGRVRVDLGVRSPRPFSLWSLQNSFRLCLPPFLYQHDWGQKELLASTMRKFFWSWVICPIPARRSPATESWESGGLNNTHTSSLMTARKFMSLKSCVVDIHCWASCWHWSRPTQGFRKVDDDD